MHIFLRDILKCLISFAIIYNISNHISILFFLRPI